MNFVSNWITTRKGKCWTLCLLSLKKEKKNQQNVQKAIDNDDDDGDGDGDEN